MSPMASANNIIDRLGGPSAVAEITGAKLNAIRQWGRIGIPYRFWLKLHERAVTTGHEDITLDALAATKAEYLAARQRAA